MRYPLLVILVTALLTMPSASAADANGDGHELILLPLAFRDEIDEIPGAFGTRWSGQVWLENRNDVEVQLYDFCMQVCGGFAPRHAGVLNNPLGVTRPEYGVLLYFPVQQAQHLTFSNRIFERTLRSQPRGVDIPVVREGSFFTGEKTFLGVPAGSGVRVNVRAYDPWSNHPVAARPGGRLESVTIEVRDKDQQLLGTSTLRPRIPNPGNTNYDFHKPGFDAISDLAGVFPAVAQLEYVHVRVRPVPATAQYWAMVSVTDNLTQTVSIVTAQ